jgi:CRISPR-associated protein Csx17
MSDEFRVIYFEGIRPDSLGNYLAGLGLLSALSRKWRGIRGTWRNGCFAMVDDGIMRDQIEKYLLENWRPTPYERWWTEKQKADTKAKVDQGIWRARSQETISKVRLLDAHIVGVGRNQFNPVLGTGGNIGKRDLAKVYEKALKLVEPSDQPEVIGWLRATLYGELDSPLPELTSAGTWFVYANKTFNSGQSWYREGQISPWSFLLALEGAMMLVGGVGRRLGANARSYAVFPFISDIPSPVSEGEVGLVKAEFWAPLWKHPATLSEVRALLERGLARIGQRTAKSPHEFAIAARSAGVDAGVTEFVRFVLRQTTSPQIYEAVPGERIQVGSADSIESQLIAPLLPWLDRLPYEPRDSKQKGNFKGLRGPIEQAIIRIAEQPNDSERWQKILSLLADAQSRIDRNKDLRERCRAVPYLDPAWVEKAWPSPPVEIHVACAIASVGAGSEMPILVNIYGAELDKKKNPMFRGDRRPQRAIWHKGDVVRLLADVIERRLIDADSESTLPLIARRFCSADVVGAFLSGALDFDTIGNWIPPLSLINWSEWQPPQAQVKSSASLFPRDGAYLLQALFRPLFYPNQLQLDGSILFPDHLRPRAATARRLLNLIRQGEWDEAVQLARSRYLAAGRSIVIPSTIIGVDNERIAASLLIPMRRSEVASGLSRWLQPHKTNSRGEKK